MVKVYLLKILVNKVIGIDGISCFFLYLGIIEFAFLIVKFINLLLLLGTFFCYWKRVRVIVFYKVGDMDDVNNYRFILVFSVLFKIIERYVYDYLFEYLNVYDFIYKN